MPDTVKGVKYQALMDTAKKLFFRYGIRRVTVEEICREARVSKMTFYKHFANKTELAKAFYLKSHENGMADYREVMQMDMPFSEKVKKLIEFKLRNTDGISQEFVADMMQDKKTGLLQFMERKGQEALAEMIRDFEKAAARGEIRRNINPLFITYFFEKMREMLADENLQAMYSNEQDLIMELTHFFFYGLGIKGND